METLGGFFFDTTIHNENRCFILYLKSDYKLTHSRNSQFEICHFQICLIIQTTQITLFQKKI